MWRFGTGSQTGFALLLAGIAFALCLAVPASAAHASGSWVWRCPLPQGNELSDVVFTDSANGWAVGGVGTVLHTHDAGAHWSIQKTGTAEFLHSVDFVDATHGWAAGWRGMILGTSDGGEHWAAQASGTNRRLRSIDFADAAHGWAVGDSGTILATTDGGAHWAPQSSGTASALAAVAFADAAHGWAVGDSGTILATTDGGAHWAPQSSGTTHDLAAACFSDWLRGWAVGESGTILVTSDGGAHWSLQSSGSTTDYLVSVSFPDASNGYAVASGKAYYTRDGGAHWVQAASYYGPCTTSCEFTDALRGCTVSSLGEVLTTVDGGTTWTPSTVRPSAYFSPQSVAFGDSTRGWAVDSSGEVYASADGGVHWRVAHSGGWRYFHGVAAPDASHVWAVGEAGQILSTADGLNWVSQTSGTNLGLRSVSFPDVLHGWAVGDDGVIVATTDGGSRWTTMTVGSEYYLRGVHFLDANCGWVVGGPGGQIFSTKDGGSRWTTQTVSDYSLTDITFADPSHGWAVGGGGTVVSTSDGGATWTTRTTGIQQALRAVSFADAQHGWVVGDSGIILATADGGAHWSAETRIAEYLNDVVALDSNSAVAVGHNAIISRALAPDTFAPRTALEYSATPNRNGWFQGDVVATLVATDDFAGSGVANTWWRVDGGAATPYRGPLTFSTEGAHTIEYASTDSSGNVEATSSKTFSIDKTPPVTTDDHMDLYAGSARITLVSSDTLSGVATTIWALDGAVGQGSVVTTSALGSHTLVYRSRDVAGNLEAVRTITFEVASAAAARLTLSASKTVLQYSWWDVTLRGVGAPRSGVILQQSIDGSTWNDAGMTWTAGAGVLKMGLNRTTFFRLLFAGDGTWLPATSNVVKVTVVPYVPSPSAPSSVRRNRTFTVTTDLAAASPNASDLLTFRFYRYEKSHGRWSWVLRKSVRGVGRAAAENAVTYRARTSLPRAGKWKVAACYWGNDMYGATASGSRSLRVK